MEYRIKDNALSIKDSYLLTTHKEMVAALEQIRSEAGEKDILKRTNENLINEWCAHNFCYNLFILRVHTRTVDFEYPQRWYFRIAYGIIGYIYKHTKQKYFG